MMILASARRGVLGTSIVSRTYGTTSMTRTRTLNPIPATFLRGGTSKGVFINRSDLPEDQSQWDPIFLGIMGSPDPEHGRQLNGMGGGISSLSKICVVGAPSTEQRQAGIDATYTFAQIGIRDSAVDYTGNCGNLSSMVGIFAVDEGICTPHVRGQTGTVRTFNTNTNKQINNTFPVALEEDHHIPILDLEQAINAGVPGKASQIVLDFISPGGAGTGKLLPTGNSTDVLNLSPDLNLRASLIDATNPSVFITTEELRNILDSHSPIDFSNLATLELLERVRREGAVRMGLDPSAQAQPKIAVLEASSSTEADIVVHALSMGVLHKAVPMTVGLCLGVAARIPRTVAWKIVEQSRPGGACSSALLKIRHPSGVVDVGAELAEDGEVKSAKVVRTGRRLMKGVVWW